MLSKAKPFNLVADIVDRKYVLMSFIEENVRSADAVVTGNVAAMWSSVCMLGNSRLLHAASASTALDGLTITIFRFKLLESVFAEHCSGGRESHFFFQISNSPLNKISSAIKVEYKCTAG
jgi:hypothetical protein